MYMQEYAMPFILGSLPIIYFIKELLIIIKQFFIFSIFFLCRKATFSLYPCFCIAMMETSALRGPLSLKSGIQELD